jgi:hypothetical protein
MVRLLQLTSLLQSDDPAATTLRDRLKGLQVVTVNPLHEPGDDARAPDDSAEDPGEDAAAGGDRA